MFRVLKHRRNEEVSIVELTAAAIAAGWRPQGKNPKRALGDALRYEIKTRGDLLAMPGAAGVELGGSVQPAFVTRTKKTSWPGCSPTRIPQSFRRLMAECDAEERRRRGP